MSGKHLPRFNPNFWTVDLFDYKTEFDVDEFLERSQEQEKQRLEEELERIKDQLEQRDRIHEENIDELEEKRDWYIERLELLYKREVGKQGEREKLKTRIEDLYRGIRKERRSHWRDRQELEKTKRKLLREAEELDSDLWSEFL